MVSLFASLGSTYVEIDLSRHLCRDHHMPLRCHVLVRPMGGCIAFPIACDHLLYQLLRLSLCTPSYQL
jgi:hypothetical protein